MGNQSIKYLIMLISLIICSLGCIDDSTGGEPEVGENSSSVLDIISEDQDLILLNEAIEILELENRLNQVEPFTLFAPDNNAIQAYLTSNGYVVLADADKEDLRGRLLYHMTSGVIRGDDFSTGYVESWNQDSPNDSYVSMFIESSDTVRINNRPILSISNIEADNGIIQVVTEILDIPSVEDIINDNEDLSTFRLALERLDLYDALSQIEAFTLFAPNNQAFDRFLEVLAVQRLEDVTDEALREVLLYHFVNTNIRISEFTSGKLPTLNTDKDIDVEISDEIRINNHVTLLKTDIQSTNGVVHIIDEVLLPTSN